MATPPIFSNSRRLSGRRVWSGVIPSSKSTLACETGSVSVRLWICANLEANLPDVKLGVCPVASALEVLVEERQAALPGVLARFLLVDLRPVVREERVGRVGIEDELDARVARLPQLGLEAPDVGGRDAGVRVAIEAEHGRLDSARQAKCVHAGRVRVDALDLPVPRYRRGHAGIFRGGVQRERAAPAEAGDPEPIGPRPGLLLGVVGAGPDIAQVLGPRDPARDLAHLLEVLPLQAALAGVHLAGDRAVAGLGEAAHHVLVLLGVAGEAGDDDHDGVAAGRLGAGGVGG